MVITNLQEKENRKLWVPIRGGNRGGWSLFDWEKVRDMPYRDREMYLGNSAKIGVLDKGGKWRKKDWYLHKNNIATGQQLDLQVTEARKRDQQRMNAALGIEDGEQKQEKLTPAELQELLKKVRGNKEDAVKIESSASGLGFDKTKVEIRARPNAKSQNPHKLEGTAYFEEQKPKKEERLKQQEGRRSRSRSEKKKKKHKKDRKEDRSKSRQKHRKREHRERSKQQHRQKKRKQKKRRHHSSSEE